MQTSKWYVRKISQVSLAGAGCLSTMGEQKLRGKAKGIWGIFQKIKSCVNFVLLKNQIWNMIESNIWSRYFKTSEDSCGNLSLKCNSDGKVW